MITVFVNIMKSRGANLIARLQERNAIDGWQVCGISSMGAGIYRRMRS